MTLKNLFNRVTFLIGAGASKDAGCFLSKDMLLLLRQDIYKEVIDSKDRNLQDHFREIHDFVLASMRFQSTLNNPIDSSFLYSNIEDFVAILNQIIYK